MRILFVNHSMLTGGAERAISNIANGLDDLGYNIYIAVFDEGKSDYQLNKSVNLVSYPVKSANKFATFYSRVKLAKKAFNDLKPDIIISFSSRTNIYSIIANFFYDSPLIISERNDPNSDPNQWYYKLLRKIIYRFSDGFVFQTNGAQKFFSKNIQERSVVIQNPVFINSAITKEKLKEKEKSIVSVGRLAQQKNHRLLIDAFSALGDEFKDYKLIIYGEGNKRDELETYIALKKLNDRVSLPGRFKDIHTRIINSSLFILSSDYEGMSNALMEAMALGIPCISTDCPIGGSSDLIENRKNGLLVSVGNKCELTSAMEELLKDTYLSERISTEAKNILYTNSFETIISQWDKYVVKIHSKKCITAKE